MTHRNLANFFAGMDQKIGVEPGVWFRVVIGGITGHRDLARDVGVVCRPEECATIADAIVRVFIDGGDRTDRASASRAHLGSHLSAW